MISIPTFIAVPVAVWLRKGVQSWPLLPYVWGGSATTWILSDLPSPAPGSFEPWLINAGAAVGILAGIFLLWNQAKQAIGRKPEIGDELKELERKIEEVDRRRSVGIAGVHSKVDARMDAADNGLQMEMRLMNARISETEVTLSALDERTKTTNHTVDSISAKVDTLLSRSRKP